MVTDEMKNELQAWREICSELEKIGIDVNRDEALVRAIQNWGDCLFLLRLTEGK